MVKELYIEPYKEKEYNKDINEIVFLNGWIQLQYWFSKDREDKFIQYRSWSVNSKIKFNDWLKMYII